MIKMISQPASRKSKNREAGIVISSRWIWSSYVCRKIDKNVSGHLDYDDDVDDDLL